MKEEIKKEVEKYYSDKVVEHGATSQGVDWNGKESHFLRFEQLCRPINFNEKFSLLDYGCGFGSLIEFLNKSSTNFIYLGYDLSDEMIKKANELYIENNISFFSDSEKLEKVDFVIANGIFNVRLETEESVWKKYILETILDINKYALKGFSFNILTSYSDEEYKKDYLYYANPLEIFDFCKKNIARNVSLIHDYDLYEFTIIVKK